MIGKRNKANVDERMVMETQKICTQGFYILLVLLSISLFVKIQVLDLPFKDVMTDLIIVLVGAGYVGVRMVLKGNAQMGMVAGKNRKKRMLQILGASAILGVVFGVVTACINLAKYQFNPKMLPTIIVPLFFEYTILMFGIMYITDKYSVKMAQKQIEDDEDEDL